MRLLLSRWPEQRWRTRANALGQGPRECRALPGATEDGARGRWIALRARRRTGFPWRALPRERSEFPRPRHLHIPPATERVPDQRKGRVRPSAAVEKALGIQARKNQAEIHWAKMCS